MVVEALLLAAKATGSPGINAPLGMLMVTLLLFEATALPIRWSSDKVALEAREGDVGETGTRMEKTAE